MCILQFLCVLALSFRHFSKALVHLCIPQCLCVLALSFRHFSKALGALVLFFFFQTFGHAQNPAHDDTARIQKSKAER